MIFGTEEKQIMELNKSKILVTGSSGTIGNCLSETLLERGADVVGADIKQNRWNEEVHRRSIYIDLRNPSCLLIDPYSLKIFCAAFLK